MAKTAFGVGRAITINTTGAFSLDGYKSLIEKIQGFEDRIANGETLATIADGSEITLLCSSKTPYLIHVFDLDANFGTGVYNADYVESVPNAESVS